MLIKEYIEHFNQNHKNEYNEYYKYLMIRGLQTMCTLFNMLFLYLKNLDITYKHCQHRIFYYVEFIGQIGNDNGGFLQLSSNKALLLSSTIEKTTKPGFFFKFSVISLI